MVLVLLMWYSALAVDLGMNGVGLVVESTPERVDVARDFFVTVTLTVPGSLVNKEVYALPDLRDRFQGFAVAEDFAEEPLKAQDGTITTVSRWRLVPEPSAKKYRLAPFAVGDFYTKPVVFEPPAARETVTGGMEIEPKKDLPPLTWKLVGIIIGALLALAAAVYGVWRLIKFTAQKVKEHRMSPIERAWLELERLVKRGLPGRGFYKDFYVELTMVVRRYIARQYGVKAPHLTTTEFVERAIASGRFAQEDIAELKKFFDEADLVKFAGLEATPEMADTATDAARDYLGKVQKLNS